MAIGEDLPNEVPEIQASAVQTYLSADLHKDGTLQVSISDDVISQVVLRNPTEETARVGLRYMLGLVGNSIPLQVEGRDFDL